MIVHIHTYTYTHNIHAQNVMYGLFREFIKSVKTFINEKNYKYSENWNKQVKIYARKCILL